MKGIWTPVTERICGMGSNSGAYSFYVTPSNHWQVAAGLPSNEGDLWLLGGALAGVYTPYMSAEAWHWSTITGWMPNHCVEFPFGDPQDIDDWYDVTRVGSLRLRLHAGDTDLTDCGVVLQQLRRY